MSQNNHDTKFEIKRLLWDPTYGLFPWRGKLTCSERPKSQCIAEIEQKTIIIIK